MDKNLYSRRVAEVAAKWWVEQLQINHYEVKKDDTDEIIDGFFEFISAINPTEEQFTNSEIDRIKQKLFSELKSYEISIAKIPQEKLDKFEKEVYSYVLGKVRSDELCCLSSDEDGAFGVLGVIANHCGIESGPDGNFPPIASMYISLTKVEVKTTDEKGAPKVVYDAEKDPRINPMLRGRDGK